jgi:hypothetical protein
MRWRWALTVLVAGVAALSGCGSDGDGDATVASFGRGEIPAPTDEEPLVGRWETRDSDGTCPGFSAAEPRVIEIRPGTDDRPYPTAIEIAGNACLADLQVAFEPSGTGEEVTAYGGSLAAPGALPAAVSAVADRSFQLQVGGETVRFERIGAGPDRDESTLLGIPSPEEAVTPRNAGLAAAIMVLLLGLVSFPAMLLNSTLEANVDTIRARWAGMLRRFGVQDAGGVEQQIGFWRRWRGMATYLVLSAVLYGMMQPGWGLNAATAVTVIGFLAALAITTGSTVLLTVWYLQRRIGTSGRPEVLTLTAPIALLGVVGSRVAGFVPGFAYGLIARYEPAQELDDATSATITIWTSVLTLLLGLGAWFALGPLRLLPDSIETIPVAAAGGVFTVAVEALLIGLIPLRFLPGSAVRTRSRVIWAVLWLSGAFLFALVLLRPGLATAQDGSTAWMLATSGTFAGVALAIWRFYARRTVDQRPSPPGAQDLDDDRRPQHGTPF